MPYRILSLDGGGAWCQVQARVLNDLYPGKTGHEVLREFDLVVANSGGSVLLGLLCNNLKLDEIIAFYLDPDKLKRLFPLLPFYRRILSLVPIFPKYSTEKKLLGLKEQFSSNSQRVLNGGDLKNGAGVEDSVLDKYLHEVPDFIGRNYQGNDLQFVISAFDFYRERASFFRSNALSVANRFSPKYYQVTLGEVIHASTNAPIKYYDKPADIGLSLLSSNDAYFDNRRSWFWDGAMAGFNNPILAGIVEAITNNFSKVNIQDIRVLSLGTGQVRKAVITDDGSSDNPSIKKRFNENRNKPFVESLSRHGCVISLGKAASSILSDPPDSATFVAYAFLNPSLNNKVSPIVRINPFISPEITNGIYHCPKSFEDDEEDFLRLMNLEFDVYTLGKLSLVKKMCERFLVTSKDTPCISNQLIRGDVDPAIPGVEYLGQATYLEARNQWLNLIS